jgi:hypothetical protein
MMSQRTTSPFRVKMLSFPFGFLRYAVSPGSHGIDFFAGVWIQMIGFPHPLHVPSLNLIISFPPFSFPFGE